MNVLLLRGREKRPKPEKVRELSDLSEKKMVVCVPPGKGKNGRFLRGEEEKTRGTPLR